MEEEEYNDIVTYIQDQKYPQNAEITNVWFTSNTTVKKIMKRRVQIKFCVLLNQSDWGKVPRKYIRISLKHCNCNGLYIYLKNTALIKKYYTRLSTYLFAAM